jgi:hypothetical protein
MTRYLSLLLMLGVLLQPAKVEKKAAVDSQAFVLDATGSTYPFSLRIEGVAERHGKTIDVTVSKGLIRSTIPTDLDQAGIARDVRVAFGLGETTAQGWKMVMETPDQPVAPRLSPGESQELGPMHFVVTGVNASQLRERWIAARLTVEQKLPGLPAGPLFSYACSETNFFGATSESKERASGMKLNYSHTC